MQIFFSTRLQWVLGLPCLLSCLLTFLFIRAACSAGVALHLIFMLHLSRETLTSVITRFFSMKAGNQIYKHSKDLRSSSSF